MNFAWSPDSQHLAAVADDGAHGSTHVWVAQTGKLLYEAPSRYGDVAWSPDGKTLAVASWDGHIGFLALVDAATWAVRTRAPGFDKGLSAIRWSPDGKTVAALEQDDAPSLHTWDPGTGKRLRSTPLGWLGGGVLAAAWSPDGRVLARRNGRGEIQLWDDLGCLRGVLLPGEPFQQLAITADGHYRGTPRVERDIRMVVQKRDGTSETLTPAEFEQKYGFKNDPEKIRLTDSAR
jgi:WD40 repeat protein